MAPRATCVGGGAGTVRVRLRSWRHTRRPAVDAIRVDAIAQSAIPSRPNAQTCTILYCGFRKTDHTGHHCCAWVVNGGSATRRSRCSDVCAHMPICMWPRHCTYAHAFPHMAIDRSSKCNQVTGALELSGGSAAVALVSPCYALKTITATSPSLVKACLATGSILWPYRARRA